jgi:N-acetylneuraminic acid mutarotase
MRPERTTSTLINSWRSTNKFVKHQLSNLTVFRAALIFSIFAGLVLSFTFSNSTITTAQEQGKTSISEILMTAQAEGVGLPGESNPVETINNQPDGGSCSWATDTVYPIPVQDQATAVAGTAIYSFGGQSNSVFTANSYRFDGTAWTAIAPYPLAVVGAGAASDGTNVYIVGGVATGSVFQTALRRYNVASNTYTDLAPATTATWNHVTLFQGGKIYKIGGSGATAPVANVEIYDIASNTWTMGAPLPVATAFGHGFVSGNFIYFAGGLTGTGATAAASLKTYRYDIAANTWDDAAIADLPEGRWAGVSSKRGYGSTNAFVIAGGFVGGITITNASATVIEWNPATNTWSSNPDMPAARVRGNGGVLGASFYNVGGAPPNFTGTNTNYRLTCVSNVAVITGGTVNITSESCTPANGAPDPGETITVTLPITNTGDTPTTNLNVTLQATGGVVASSTQNFGVIAPGGAAVTRTFTFTVASTVACGSDITLTFTPTDGTTTYPTITRTFTTGARQVLLSQNFDAVTAPALPAGWTTVQLSGTAINWVTTTTTPSSPPNAAFANDPATVNLSALVSPAVAVNTTMAQITFRNQFNTETNSTEWFLNIRPTAERPGLMLSPAAARLFPAVIPEL